MEEFAKGNIDPHSSILSPLIIDRREIALMHEIQAFMDKPENKGRTVVFIYGVNHDFSKYFTSGSLTRLDAGTASLRPSPPKFYDIEILKLPPPPPKLYDIEKLNKALEKFPGATHYRLERAEILLSQKKETEALADYEFVLSSYPANQVAQDAVKRLKSIHANRIRML